MGLFNHLKMFTDLHQRGTLTEHPISLTQLTHDLLTPTEYETINTTLLQLT